MIARTIKIASSRWATPMEFTTTADNWGQLKAELGGQVLNYEGSPMKALLKCPTGRITLDNDALELPEANFAVILVPEKVKSGANIIYNVATLRDIKTKIVRMLDFLIEATENGAEIVLPEELEELGTASDVIRNLGENGALSFDLETISTTQSRSSETITFEEPYVSTDVDPLILEARQIAEEE